MAYSDDAKRYAAEIMENRRLLSVVETENRRAEAYGKAPGLRDIEAQISSIGLSSVRLMVSGSPDGVAESMTAQINELRQKQRLLLAKKGMPEDMLEPLHSCAKCGDTGIADSGGTCVCVKKLLREYSLREIKRVSPLALCDFGTFSLDYYPTAYDEEYNASPRDIMKQNLAECVQFANDFPRHNKNLLMLGDAGLGKTHLALSIANSVLQRGYDVVYCSASNIFKQIEIEHFENRRETATLDSLKRCDLLVLDDLGAEFISPFANTALYDIVNTRLISKKLTVYTTNITKDDVLTIRYGEKIMSRLVGCSTVLPFVGEDIRIQKNDEEPVTV